MRLARRALLGAGAAACGSAWTRAQDAPPIVIGLLLALTGPLTRASEDIAFGLGLAFDETGWRAGGRPLKVLMEDTHGQPQRALEAFARFAGEQRADLVIGPTTSPEALALRDAAHEAGLPLVVPNAGVDALTGERCSPFVIRISYANQQIAVPLARWLAEEGGVKSVYMLAAGNIAGRDHVADFGPAFVAAGGEIAGEELVPVGTRDFAPYLAKLKLLRTEAIFASFFGESAQRLLDALDELGLRHLKLVGPGWLASTLDLGRAGVKAAGIIGATIWLPDLDEPGNRAFVEAFTKRHQRPPTEFAAQGFGAGRLVVAALDALDGATKNRRALAAVLARTPFNAARGELTIDPRTNNVVQNVYIFEVRARAGGEGVDLEILHKAVGVAADPDQCTMPG